MINVSGDYYVVIKVERDKKSNYIVEAIPPFYTDTTTVANSIPCPPLMPEIPTVRRSEPQVAFVEKNLDPDRLGRVRIRYPWQKSDGDCSPWVRMATPFATKGGGVTFRPGNGDEVLLNYEDGNIERPYVVGSLQSKYVTDYGGALADRVIQSKNGHAITFTDKNNSRSFFMGMVPGLRTLNNLIPASSQLFDWSQGLADLAGGISISDRYGLYSINMSSDGRVVNINSPLGNVNLNAFTGINISAPNGNINIKGKNVKIEASNKLTLESGSAVTDHFWWTKDAWASGSDALNTLLFGVGSDLFDRTLNKWIDFSFFRTILEVFLRPIDGTLKIKSNTYVLIEAGKGSAQIPVDDFKHPNLGQSTGIFDPKMPAALEKLENSIDKLTQRANVLCNDIHTAFCEAKAAKEKYEKVDNYKDLTDGQSDKICQLVLKNQASTIGDIIKEEIFKFNDVIGLKYVNREDNGQSKTYVQKEETEEEKKNTLKHVNYFINCQNSKRDWDKKETQDKIIEGKRKNIVDCAQDFGKKIIALVKATKEWETYDLDPKDQADCYYDVNKLITPIRNLDIFGGFIAKWKNGTADWPGNFDSEYAKELTILRRKIVFEFMKYAKDLDECKAFFSLKDNVTIQDYADDEKWMDLAKAIEEPKDSSIWSETKGNWKKYIKSIFYKNNPWFDTFRFHRWKSAERGRILLSDQPGKTLRFDSDELAANDNHGQMTLSHLIAFRRKVNSVK